ncbi:MAG: beta strand repeat-containing protein, partial [Methylophagaceae bacterium]
MATQTSSTATETYSLNIDGTIVSVTAPISSTIADVVTLFTSAINANPIVSLIVTAIDGVSKLVIRSDAAGANFTSSVVQEPTLNLTFTNIIGSAEFIISGTVSSVFNVPVTYTYTVSTTGNIFGCATESSVQGTIRVSPPELIIHDNLIPENSFGTSTSTLLVNNGSLNQSVCENTAIEPIRIDITGSATNASISALVGTIGLPPGVNLRVVSTAQVNSIGVTALAGVLSATYQLIINGLTYEYSGLNSATASDVASGLVAEIFAAGVGTGITATISATSDSVIILTSNTAGTPFIVTPVPISTTASITFSVSEVVSNTNYLVIEGTPTENVLATKTYSYEVISNGSVSLLHSTILGTITLLPDAVISLKDINTDNQSVCNGTAITPIIYQVFNGASDLTVSNLPPGFSSVTRDTNATSIVSLPTGNLTATETYTLNIQGVSVSYVGTIGDTQSNLATALQTAIKSKVSVNSIVTATGTVSQVSIAASAAGSAGSFSLSVVTSNTLGMTIEQTIGTSEFEINGNTIIGSFQDLDTWTYIYSITTSNTNACNITDVIGSIAINPSQSIDLDVTTDDDGDSFADFTGSLSQQACVGNSIDPIRFNLSGGASSASVPILTGTTGLPNGVLSSQFRTSQVAVIDLTTTNVSSQTYTIRIDNIDYSYTTVTNTTTVSQVISNLINTINSATGVSEAQVIATVSGTTAIVITSKIPGDLFTTSTPSPTLLGGGTISENVAGRIANENYIVVSGIPNPTIPLVIQTTYNYTFTTSGTNCLQDTITGSIDLVPSSTISLTSLNTTIAQIVCVGDTIDNIVYGIGGGATGATISGNPSGTTGGYAGGIFTISGIPTTAVSVTTIYTYTISSTGNIGCVETSVQGTIKVVPNIIIDEVGIAGLITHITCENADDGRIGHPTTEPLDAFVTGGLTNIAQVDRIYLNQDLSSVNPVAPSIGDIFTVTINSNSYTHTVVGISGGLTGPAQTVTQTAKFLGDLINTGETSLTAQANIFGDGTINLMANTPGIGFSASVIKQVPKVLRITVTGSVDTNHVSITIGSTVYGYTVNGTGLAKVASDIVSATSPSTIVSATANGDGTVNLVGNVVGNDYIFSRTVS